MLPTVAAIAHEIRILRDHTAIAITFRESYQLGIRERHGRVPILFQRCLHAGYVISEIECRLKSFTGENCSRFGGRSHMTRSNQHISRTGGNKVDLGNRSSRRRV